MQKQTMAKNAKKIVAILVSLALACSVFALAGCSKEEKKTAASDENRLEATDVPQDVDPYVLLIGDDSWEKYTPGKSDMMMLMKMDFDNNQLYLVSIPRDTEYEDTTGTLLKANDIYKFYGIEGALKAAGNITGVNISQYAIVGFGQLEKIVDYFGGVDVNIPLDITYQFYTKDYPDESFTAGEQTLDGWRAMVISRARKGYDEYGLDNDMPRQIIIRNMVESLAASAYSSPLGVDNVLAALYDQVETNIPLATMQEWATKLGSSGKLTIYGTSGPVDGGLNESVQLWLIPYDKEKWSTLMNVVNKGGDPASVNVQFPGNYQSDNIQINSKVVIDTSSE